MAERLYSYRDILLDELDTLWQRSRDPEDNEEPELVLVGVRREAVIVTECRVYHLSAGSLPLQSAVERVSVRPLAELAEAHVREGLFLCRLRLGFENGDEMQLRVRLHDRDKMRVAARMLSTLALDAREAAKAAAVARQSRAQAEAAASRMERAPARPIALRVQPQAAATDPATEPAVPAANATGVASGSDVVELLRGLWQLVEVGALSSAEFQAKKADLLGRV